MGSSGSLIAPGTILTAAHCVHTFRHQAHKLKIRCGEWDTQNQTEPRPHQDRYVSNLDIHPEFDPKNLASDYALLYTAQPFELQEHIDTICLPDPEEIFDGQTCFATGWGKDQFGAAGQYQVVLKEIDLPVVGHHNCETALRNSRLKLLVNQKFLEINQLGSTRLLNFHSKLDGRVDELDHLVHVGDIQTPGGDSWSAKPNTRWIESRLVPGNCVLVARNANRLQDKFTLSSTKRSRTLLEIHVNDMTVSASCH